MTMKNCGFLNLLSVASLMLPTNFDDVDDHLSHLSDHNVGKIFIGVFIILTMIL